MKKSRLFIENMMVYGFGQVISKIIPFIMLPIITRLMPSSYYMGINDMNVLIVSFGTQIVVMGMYDAMFRLYFDKNEKKYHKIVCSTALINCFVLSLIVFVITIMLRTELAQAFFSDKSLSVLLLLTSANIVSDGLKSIISAPTRIQNKKKVFLIINTIMPIISYGISIPLLLKGMYLYALPIASLSSSITMLIIFYVLNRKFFDFRFIEKNILSELLKIGVPLMPTFLIYWIFSSFDRFMILKMLGASAAGVYAVGNKVAMISQLIYQAFAGGWSYFSFSTMNDSDQVKTNTKIFNYLAAISFVAYGIMLLFSEIIFKIMFTTEYFEASRVFPYLFISPLLLMLFQILGNQFIIIKKSYYVTLSLIIGAALNVLLNYFMIPMIGIEGASIATVIGYIVSLIIIMNLAKARRLFIFTKKFNLMFFALLITILCSAMHFTILKYLFGIILIILIVILYISDFKKILFGLLKKGE